MGYIGIKQQETYGKLQNRGWCSKYAYILIMLLLLMTKIMMIILLLVLLLLLLTNNESNSCNNYNNNNVIIIITIKMKRLKVAIYIACLISYSVKKMLLNSMFVSAKVICCCI